MDKVVVMVVAEDMLRVESGEEICFSTEIMSSTLK
jgi:hypothetical protein